MGAEVVEINQAWPVKEADIGPGWISDVLSASLQRKVEVESISRQRVGTGQVGECWRLELQFSVGRGSNSDRELPNSVVVKLAATDPTSRAAGHSQSCYLREVGFYRDLQHRVEVRTPKCHFAAIAENETDHVLVLEDMAPAQQGDQLAGCAIDTAQSVLGQLALLHGPLWRDDSLAQISWLERPNAEANAEVRTLFGAVYPGFLDRYAGRLSGPADQVVRWFGEHLDDLFVDETVLCPVHNDFRLDNMLFGDGVSAPEVTIVDWQTVKLGSGPRDAAYFVGAGLTTETRRRRERELIESSYFRPLVAAGAADFDFEECWSEYRLGTFGGLIMAVVASMLVGETARGDEMFLTMARRHAQHILDLDAQSVALG